VLTGHDERHEALAGLELDVLVLLQVVGLRGRRVDEDGERRGDGRGAAPEDGDVERVEPRLLEAELGGDLAGRVHVRHTGGEQQPGGGEVRAVRLVAGDEPVLLAGGVEVVHAGGEAGLDDLGAVLAERADHVAHDARAAEQLGQRLHVVGHLHDLVVGGLDAGHVGVHRGLDLLRVATGGGEGDAVLAEVLADEAAGVAGGAVDDDGLAAHGVLLGLGWEKGAGTARVTCPCRRRRADRPR
jgi:hypothetical protein